MEENEKRRNVELAYLSLMLSGKKVSECELASEVLKISRAKGEKSLAMLVQSSIKITVKVLSVVLVLKEGTNLNQLMYFVNAQGLPAYNEKAVFRTLEKVYQNARKVDRFIEELEKRYHVDYVPHDYLADEPDNRNL